MDKRVISIVLNPFTHDARVLKEVLSLKKAGFWAKVIAIHEEGLPEYEIQDGIEVIRIKLHTKKFSKNIIFKVLKYIELIIKALRLYGGERFIHCNDLDTLPLGYLIKRVLNRGVKLIYDAHEYETDVYWVRGFKKRLSEILERFLIKEVDRMITVSEAIANEYVKDYGINPRPQIVYNCPPFQELKPTKTNLLKELMGIPEEKTVFLYQGGLSSSRQVDKMMEAFLQIEKELKGKVEIGKKVFYPCIAFLGNGALANKISEVSQNSELVFYHKAVPPQELWKYTVGADFGFSFLDDSCRNHFLTLPNKLFEYLMMRVPIIVSSGGQLGYFVERYKVGVVVDKTDQVEKIKTAIYQALSLDKKQLLQNIEDVRKKYNWENQEKKLIEVYKELLENLK